MLLLRTFAPWLLVAFLGHQMSLCSGARSKNRGAGKAVTPAPGRAQGSGDKPAANGRGKFSIDSDGRWNDEGKMQCTWRAKDVADTVRLSVKCENPEARVKGGVTDLQCHYNAKPQSCPGYQSDPKGFWKQVARAFKKLQGKVCRDERAQVKAGMCKRAPRDAHFKLDFTSTVVSAQQPETPLRTPRPPPSRSTTSAADTASPTPCSGRAYSRRKAEEHCSSSWASLCTFVFSMLQNDDC